MSRVATPSDRRFRRAHIKPAARRRWRWQRMAVWAGGGGLIALALAYGGYHSVAASGRPMLAVSRIEVRGNVRLSEGEVLALVGGLRGESLLGVDLGVWRTRLMSSPWVKDAALRRSLPSTVEVVVLERQPLGIARLGDEMHLVDDRGVIIDQFGPPYADLDLPIIDGLAASGGGGLLTDEARAELAARVIASIGANEEVARRLSQVDVSDVRNASVILSGDPAVIELGEDEFLERLEAYLELAPALRERVNGVDTVDARFENRLYVRPSAKPARPGTPPAAAPDRPARRR
jgi:cell division septal protein FtsQ